MKDFIETILPYYTCFIILIAVIITFYIRLKEFIIKTLGSCIYLDEVDMVVIKKEIKSIQKNDSQGNLDRNKNTYCLYLEYPNNHTCIKQISVSRNVYNKTRIRDIVKMHEAIYKYKDVYLKSIEKYSQSNIDKYNKCQDSDKELFSIYNNDILNKCNEYKDKSNKIKAKVAIIVGFGILSIILMALFLNVQTKKKPKSFSF